MIVVLSLVKNIKKIHANFQEAIIFIFSFSILMNNESYKIIFENGYWNVLAETVCPFQYIQKQFSNDHIFRSSSSQMLCKINVPQNFGN